MRNDVFNPSIAEAGLFRKNELRTIATDAPALGFAATWYWQWWIGKPILVFQQKGSQPPLPSDYQEIIENTNVFYVLRTILPAKR